MYTSVNAATLTGDAVTVGDSHDIGFEPLSVEMQITVSGYNAGELQATLFASMDGTTYFEVQSSGLYNGDGTFIVAPARGWRWRHWRIEVETFNTAAALFGVVTAQFHAVRGRR